MKVFSLLSAASIVGAAAAASGSKLASIVEVRAPAPSPGPAPAGKPFVGMSLTFNVLNLNYMDLHKETCLKKKIEKAEHVAKAPKASKDGDKAPVDPLAEAFKPLDNTKTPSLPGPNATKAMQDIHKHADAVTEEMGGDKPKESGLPWMKKKEQSFLQSPESPPEGCTFIFDVLRDTIKNTVETVIQRMYQKSLLPPAPSPGPVPLPSVKSMAASPAAASAFLQGRNRAPGAAPGAAPGPAPATEPKANVVVFFQPVVTHGDNRAVAVHITLLDSPANGLADLQAAYPLLKAAIDSGVFHKAIYKALKSFLGFKPKLGGYVLKKEQVIEQWPVKKCEDHMKAVVKTFTLHYTREQVPMALYNECTTFITKISFSHDYVLDPMDTIRCRRATVKFAKKWNFGKNAKDEDFASMCVNACEAKYGRAAPQCNVETGDKLSEQPLL